MNSSYTQPIGGDELVHGQTNWSLEKSECCSWAFLGGQALAQELALESAAMRLNFDIKMPEIGRLHVKLRSPNNQDYACIESIGHRNLRWVPLMR